MPYPYKFDLDSYQNLKLHYFNGSFVHYNLTGTGFYKWFGEYENYNETKWGEFKPKKSAPAAWKLWTYILRAKGDAAVAVLSFQRKVAMAKRMGRIKEKGKAAPWLCHACRKMSPLRTSDEMRKHIGSCSEWDKLDEIASRLLARDPEEFSVMVNEAIMRGDLPSF